MTTEHAIATNATALRNLADRLERMGYAGGDAYAEAEHIALNLLADGWKPLDPPVPPRGGGSTEAAREAALAAAAAAIATARHRRTGATA